MKFYLVAAIASLGGLLFGYDTGVISGALLFIREAFHLGPAMQGLVAGIVLAGATVGAAFGGSLADRFGRRHTIVGAATLFVAGAVLTAFAPDIAVLLAGRVVVGLAIGVASLLTPLYLSEMAPARHRGAVVSLNQVCITSGIVISYLVGYAFAAPGNGWRWMLGLGALPGVVLGLGMLTLPESPRWLVAKGRKAAAEAALRRIRTDSEAAAEARELEAHASTRLAPWSALAGPGTRRPMIIGIGLAVFQQITGINTVIYFAPTIFQGAGLASASASILATAGVGVINLLMTIVALRLLDVLGRRVLLLIGLAGMAVTLLALAAGFLFGGGTAWITVGAVAAYVGCFAIGLGPVFWLLISEIFPLAVRGRAMGVATVANWLANLVVTLVFLDLVAALGRGGTFLLFALLTLAALLFAWRLVPETKGRSLEQIEADMAPGQPPPRRAPAGGGRSRQG